ncbi:hypothetical protein EGW08_008500 [Elysia chlorotica]|uniref:guanylate cyclase n=1 Tax=Elysia chlorotica TaxID=188477 RepID=A0A3S1A660_ELYCH|nr:hypothetical protein EGW08_008500 [Elysia chlorotica]
MIRQTLDDGCHRKPQQTGQETRRPEVANMSIAWTYQLDVSLCFWDAAVCYILPPNKEEQVPFPPKVPSSSSLNSQEIVDVVRPEIGATKVLDGMCRSEPLTDTGKRLQLLKILSLTLLPILGLWAFTVYSLSDSIQGKFDIEQTARWTTCPTGPSGTTSSPSSSPGRSSKSSSTSTGQWWFDNMTLYLDTLLIIQQELAGLINGQLEEIIQAEEKNLTISACFLVIVILMCPLVIYTVEALTSDIQKYAIALVHKTKELSKEKKKMDELLYQMVPRPVADRLKMTKEVDAEYFKSVTIMFSDIFGFTRISQECSPLEIVNLLNVLYTEIDERLDHYDVYKVEAINDSYMVASGLPTRIGNRHSAEVANLALDLLSMVMDNRFTTPMERMIQLRIGINTGIASTQFPVNSIAHTLENLFVDERTGSSGPCMAGIVGTIMPRYCLFGDAVNTASRMKSYGSANKIHISPSTYNSLRKHGVYVMAHRGKIMVKGKGSMMTYWLLTRTGNDVETPSNMAAATASETSAEEPGEVQQNFSSGKFSMFGLSGVQPSLATQLGHGADKVDKLDTGASGRGSGDARPGGTDCHGQHKTAVRSLSLDCEKEPGEVSAAAGVRGGVSAEHAHKQGGGGGGREGREDGEKGGEEGCKNGGDKEGGIKKEVEICDEKKLDELPALQRLKILAKKVKEGAYEADDDGKCQEGEEGEEGEEGIENGVEEDGDNDVFGSDKKINKS